MATKSDLKILLILILLLMTGPLGAEEASKKPWRAQMQELSKAMGDIAPALFADDKKTNKAEFTKKAKQLFEISKGLDKSAGHSMIVPDGDPTLPFLTHLFREDIERAYHIAQEGHIQYAKEVLRSSVTYCIACHTRAQTGPQFPMLDSFTSQLKGASWFDRISFQAASRQFDTVFQQVMGQLKEGNKLAATPLELEKGVKIALAISIRVKQNPQQALLLARTVSESKLVNANLKKDADQWQKDLRAWGNEKNVKYNSDLELLTAARNLVGNLATTNSSTWVPGSEVKFLRASLLMHDLLRKYPESGLVAEALYLIGLSYDVLQDLGIWSLHEMYYQVCIEKAPHSALAHRCYERYKESVVFGYSGSSGTNVPEAVQLHLKRLEKLSAIGEKL